jgi:phenylalanyl-tRNA synthetase alpha chain
MPDVKHLQHIENLFLEELPSANDSKKVSALRLKFFGKKGVFTLAVRNLLQDEEINKKEVGQEFNRIKTTLEHTLAAKEAEYSSASSNNSAHTHALTDLTLPGIRPHLGHVHPTTAVLRKINSFFRYLGYSVYEGPEIETNEFNFEKLNLPEDHPARELADTLYIMEPEVLLRTHTSSVETRAMTNEELPLRIVVPGKVYRNENSNTTNNSMFYQYEGLVVDKGINMVHLNGTLHAFVRFLYGDDVKVRFRCKYYPQVEPGAGLDIQCMFCSGKGCSVCKYRGWIEVLGSGMVHPNVLRACNIDPTVYSGFAFGMGLDRLVMLSYGITDIRKLYNGELFFE